jgi:hypothetical protein
MAISALSESSTFRWSSGGVYPTAQFPPQQAAQMRSAARTTRQTHSIPRTPSSGAHNQYPAALPRRTASSRPRSISTGRQSRHSSGILSLHSGISSRTTYPSEYPLNLSISSASSPPAHSYNAMSSPSTGSSATWRTIESNYNHPGPAYGHSYNTAGLSLWAYGCCDPFVSCCPLKWNRLWRFPLDLLYLAAKVICFPCYCAGVICDM